MFIDRGRRARRCRSPGASFRRGRGLAHGRCWVVDRSQRRGTGGTVVSHTKRVGLHRLPRRRSGTAPLQDLGRGGGCTGLGGTLPEGRETHHPLRSDTASSLDAIKPGRHRRLQQRVTAPGGSQTRASQCFASLSTPSIPEIQAKEKCCPTATTDPRGGRLNLQDPFIPGVGVGSLKSLGKTGWGGVGGMGGTEGWWVFGCTRIKGGRVSWGRRGATPIHRLVLESVSCQAPHL